MVDFSSDSTRTAPRHVPTGTYAKGSLLEDTARLHNRRGRLRGIYQSRLLTRQGPAFARGPLVTRSARSSPTVPYFALQDPRSLNTSVLCVSSKPRDDLLFFFFSRSQPRIRSNLHEPTDRIPVSVSRFGSRWNSRHPTDLVERSFDDNKETKNLAKIIF